MQPYSSTRSYRKVVESRVLKRRFARLLLLIQLLVFFSGCIDPKRRAKSLLKEHGSEQIRHDAAILYKEMFSGHGKPDFVEVWYKNWPATFQQFAPEHVGAYIDGFSIAMSKGYAGEVGLYVVPQSMDHQPKALEGTTFQELADGVYWYSFGGSR